MSICCVGSATDAVWRGTQGCEQDPQLKGLRPLPLLLTIHVYNPYVADHIYNPYVADQDVEASLRRYCEELKGGTRLRDDLGIWNGKSRYVAKLREKPGSPGESVHPPGTFSIGPNRGFLSSPGQPLYCRRCGGLGHQKADCTGLRCRFCGGSGHRATECRAPKLCSLRGAADHLFRDCPSRGRS